MRNRANELFQPAIAANFDGVSLAEQAAPHKFERFAIRLRSRRHFRHATGAQARAAFGRFCQERCEFLGQSASAREPQAQAGSACKPSRAVERSRIATF
jgi:hypothetical protein